MTNVAKKSRAVTAALQLSLNREKIMKWDRDAALEIAKQQIEDHHRFLQQDVDKIVEIKTEVTAKLEVYLHAPIWFIKYSTKEGLPVNN